MNEIETIPDSEVKTSTITPIQLGLISRASNPRQVLVNMINSVSVKKYDLNTWDFTDTASMPDGSFTNTSTNLASTAKGSGLFNKRPIRYDRIHVSDLGYILVDKGLATFVSELLPAINGLCQTFISDYDIIDETLPSADSNGKVLIDLKFVPKSVQFYSGHKVVLATRTTLPVGTLTKADVGLPHVDDVADIDKIVSSLQAVAIAGSLEQAKVFTQQSIAAIPPDDDSGSMNNYILDGENF